MYLGSQLPLYQNVHIRVFNKNTGEVRIERTCKNRVTRLMLWGIARFLSGEFNDSTPDKIYEYIPRFLALGSNQASADAALSGVTTAVTVNDTRLLNEHKLSTSTGRSEMMDESLKERLGIIDQLDSVKTQVSKETQAVSDQLNNLQLHKNTNETIQPAVNTDITQLTASDDKVEQLNNANTDNITSGAQSVSSADIVTAILNEGAASRDILKQILQKLSSPESSRSMNDLLKTKSRVDSTMVNFTPSTANHKAIYVS